MLKIHLQYTYKHTLIYVKYEEKYMFADKMSWQSFKKSEMYEHSPLASNVPVNLSHKGIPDRLV